MVAGFSVGELAAWGVAGALDSHTTLELVARRAELMDAATVAGGASRRRRLLPPPRTVV
ncbi:MAG: hypothetical protein KIT14_02830 [bacterium]|nr:hypothetical protein [bacterium]